MQHVKTIRVGLSNNRDFTYRHEHIGLICVGFKPWHTDRPPGIWTDSLTSRQTTLHLSSESVTPLRQVGVSLVTLLLAVSVAGCAASEAGTQVVEPPGGLSPETVLLDVRSPEEFSQGHLEGAININVESPQFGGAISQLDPEKVYLVYCRSGRRSGIALNQMQALGFNVTNLGSVNEASVATGVPVTN